MQPSEQYEAVRREVAAEFGSALTAEQIDAQVSHALSELRAAITDYSLVAAATQLCRQRCSELAGRSETDGPLTSG